MADLQVDIVNAMDGGSKGRKVREKSTDSIHLLKNTTPTQNTVVAIQDSILVSSINTGHRERFEVFLDRLLKRIQLPSKGFKAQFELCLAFCELKSFKGCSTCTFVEKVAATIAKLIIELSAPDLILNSATHFWSKCVEGFQPVV